MTSPPFSNKSFHLALLTWFDAARRDLPWRRPKTDSPTPHPPSPDESSPHGPPSPMGSLPNNSPSDISSPPNHPPLDPYAILVSEAMLQQTQVATVIPYFHRWMAAFPTLTSLANATEQQVLTLWAGLGYYNRARNLHKTAKALTHQPFPTTAQALLTLPGIGPYTAAAIASIAFNEPTPLVDGNVERVLSRIFAYPEDPRTPQGKRHLWSLAHSLMSPNTPNPQHSPPPKRTRHSAHPQHSAPGTQHSPPPTRTRHSAHPQHSAPSTQHSPLSLAQLRPGDHNSALMELGALICLPKNPHCLLCPVATFCQARALNLQSQIPPPKKSKPTPEITRQVLCLQRPDHTYLLEQRPPTGRWPSLWQFPTRPTDKTPPLPPKTKPKPLTTLTHALTHRRYTFQVLHAKVPQSFHLPTPTASTWTTLDNLPSYPLSKPQSQIATLLRTLPHNP